MRLRIVKPMSRTATLTTAAPLILTDEEIRAFRAELDLLNAPAVESPARDGRGGDMAEWRNTPTTQCVRCDKTRGELVSLHGIIPRECPAGGRHRFRPAKETNAMER